MWLCGTKWLHRFLLWGRIFHFYGCDPPDTFSPFPKCLQDTRGEMHFHDP